MNKIHHIKWIEIFHSVWVLGEFDEIFVFSYLTQTELQCSYTL